jgi:hypothetical protein
MARIAVAAEREDTARKVKYRIFEQLLRDVGLPEPAREHRFAAPRRWAFDYAWPAFRIAVEVEGGIFVRGRHTRAQGFIRDMAKYNAAAMRGWFVFRLDFRTFTSPTAVELVREALVFRGGWTP